MIKQDYTLEILKNGARRYFYKDDLHRLNDPAVAWPNGYSGYFVAGHRHRLDGPAVIRSSGIQYYFVNGESMSKEDFYDNYYQEK